MIYDINTISLDSILSDTRLVNELMRNEPILTENEAREKIRFAYDKCEQFKKPDPVKSNDHQPCQDCGGSEFVRTGTCFACLTCGASQGCS